MSEERNVQEVTVSLMGDTAFGEGKKFPYMDDGPSTETGSSSGELAAEPTEADVSRVLDPERLLSLFTLLATANCDKNDSAPESNESSPAFCCDTTVTGPRVAGNFANEIEEFMLGVRRYFKNRYGGELQESIEMLFRLVLPLWNTFLQLKQGIPDTSAIISSDIEDDINKFIPWLEGVQWTEEVKKVIKRWLPEWNRFLRARAGETLVTRCNLFFTSLGFLLYLVDLVSDIGTSMFYASNGQWWRAILTLAIVYGAVVCSAIIKWRDGHINCPGAADWLRYVASSLVNWPDVKLYGELCRLEWKLHKSLVKNAHLVPECHQTRARIALLKFMEGVCEACPQSILQLYLLVPNLYGAWTWTDYFRIAGASVSLCTAGAALVNWEKLNKIDNYTDLPPSELVVLHVWAVPVTVSRLLSVSLLVTVHPYWALAGVALHLILYGVYGCRTRRVPRTLDSVILICLYGLQFFMSPFVVAGSVTSRRVRHAIHFLVNTAATVVWALGTPLECAHPALYTAIICFNAVLFAMGLVGWQLHENYWPASYPKRNG